jgi:hypothetical protein
MSGSRAYLRGESLNPYGEALTHVFGPAPKGQRLWGANAILHNDLAGAFDRWHNATFEPVGQNPGSRMVSDYLGATVDDQLTTFGDGIVVASARNSSPELTKLANFYE